MEQEREGLVEKLRKAQSRSDASAAEIAELKSQLSEMTTATKDMSVAHDELKAKVEILEKVLFFSLIMLTCLLTFGPQFFLH